MGTIQPAPSVLLFAGFIYGDPAVFLDAKDALSAQWGAVVLESEPFDFTHTQYYGEEMGPDLKRAFAAFSPLIDPTGLSRCKRESNLLEERYMRNGNRAINIDPGYLDAAKVVLASTKDFSHRIYLEQGIFAELTLRYIRGSYEPVEWTYPDYRDARTQVFLTAARGQFLRQLRIKRETCHGK